jgi:putative membrane protein
LNPLHPTYRASEVPGVRFAKWIQRGEIMKTLTLFAFILGTSTLVFAAPNDHGARLENQETRIVAHVHAVDRLEMELGKLAQSNGTSSVKAYGRMLANDHMTFDNKLVAFANHRGISTIPPDDMMATGDKTEIDTEKGKLQALKGPAFDREFLPFMKTSHDNEIDKLDKNMGDIHDPELKSMMESLKPTLQHHADEAQRLERSEQTSQR